MKLVTAAQMRELDRRTIDEAGIAGADLMYTAGVGLAESIRRLARIHQLDRPQTLFIAGHGNNGGDAFVAAALLHELGWPVDCWLSAAADRVRGDALVHFDKMRTAGVVLRVIDTPHAWSTLAADLPPARLVVDGLLGTGATGAPRGTVAAAIDFINAASEHSLIIAIDTPSAMAVRSDVTVAMGLPKVETVLPENVGQVGNLEVVEIGIPHDFIDAASTTASIELLDATDVAKLIPHRARTSHKGVFGHALCLGGSMGFSGAITMAARSAARSGAGLVSVVVPTEIHALVAPAIPEAMTHDTMPEGRWTAVLIGPGMGRSKATRDQVLELLGSSTLPVVLDADAITVLAADRSAITHATRPVILTPHPGEFAALFALEIEDVQADRFGMARMAAEELGATVILKGAGTVVAHPDRPLAINMTGNPGMATGGSGDVLAGIVCGLLAQGLSPFDAARAGVWLHGRAGDLAAAATSQATMIAPDLLDRLSGAFRELSPR